MKPPPPLPEGSLEPTTSAEILMLVLGGLFTVVVAGFLIVMVIRFQLREHREEKSRDDVSR